jgi:uncharacterized protein (TIGR01244 family)
MKTEKIYNYLEVDEMVSTAGQPTAAQIASAAEEGFQTIINLAPEKSEHSVQDEGWLVRSLGMGYIHIPVDWENPLVSDFDAFEQALKALPAGRILVHCAANYRASAFYSLYAQKNLGWSTERAESFRAAIWHGSDYPLWEKFISKIREGFDLMPNGGLNSGKEQD